MTRDELYQLVWSKPVTHVAKEFGVSDVAIRKICKKHGIPLPPLGYWAKLQHGKKVFQSPLPPLEKGQTDRVRIQVHETVERPEAVLEAHETAKQEELKEGRQIFVPTERPERLHSVAAATEKALHKAKPDGEGFVTSHGAGKFNVSIGTASIDRVVLLIHTLLQASLERGHHPLTTSDFRILVDEQPLAIRVYETKDKIPHIPTNAELKAQEQRDNDRVRYPTLYSGNQKAYRSWDYVPSGRVVLEISDPLQARWQSEPIFGRWYDRKSKGLESYLSEMMVALKTGAAIARDQRTKEAEAARVAKEAEQRRVDQGKQLRLLKRVTTFLEEKADKHEKLAKIERLATFLGLDVVNFGVGAPSELESAFEFVLVNLRRQITMESMNKEIIETHLLDPDRWY